MNAAKTPLAARRALWRWAWRLFRREWRQQLLVLLLIMVATAIAIMVTSAAYTLSPLATTPGRNGSANQTFTHSGEDAALLEENIAIIADWFGTVDVINHRLVSTPGTGALIEMRGQDPQGAFSAPMLHLLNGRFPQGAGEVAVTDMVAERLQLDLNTEFSLADDELRVVGFVENPGALRDEFMLMELTQVEPQTVTILASGTYDQFLAFPWPENGLIGHGIVESMVSGVNEQALSAAVALAASTIVMILVALVAATGFSIVAQRRRRQLGMLAAIGATARQLRSVMVANGAIVGLFAGIVGTIIGITSWILLVPTLEETVIGARINEFDLLPWWLIGIGVLLAVASATWAAWLPVRAITQMPIVSALSGRPTPLPTAMPTVKRVGVLLAIGLLCLITTNFIALAWVKGLFLSAGAAVMIVGTLLLAPAALQVLSNVASRMPIGLRLAWRDLARFQARTATALAAGVLALGLAVVVVLLVARNERLALQGDLSDRQLLVTERGGRIREFVTLYSPEEVHTQQTQLEQVAGAFDDVTLFALRVAVDPAEPPRAGDRGTRFRNAILIGEGAQTAKPGPLFVATPELLRHYDIDPDTLDPNIDILTIRAGEIGLRRGIEEQLVENVMRIDLPAYRSAPTSFITQNALERYGWEAAHAAWFIVSERPISSQQLTAARTLADQYELFVEGWEGIDLATLRTLRSGVVAAVVTIALTIFAITVLLIRGETAVDMRILTATGATSAIRRTITASSAGGLALLGVLLGTIGALAAVSATFITELDSLFTGGMWQFAGILFGVPLLAVSVGWLLGGREPKGRVRQTP